MSKADKALIEVAWYLSKYGTKKPPTALGVNTWKEAVALFYPLFGVGKSSVEFYNSLKNRRDRFDSWLSVYRIGWRNTDGSPRELSAVEKHVMNRMNSLSESVAEQRILSLVVENILNGIENDIRDIRQDKNLDETTRNRLIAAQLGQGDFRKNCLKLYPQCPVTKISFQPLLRASHIKPWSDCTTGSERLDPFNGIMLAAHIDTLFDNGWISFHDNGELILSTELDSMVKKQLQLPNKIEEFPSESALYLQWHRENILKRLS